MLVAVVLVFLAIQRFAPGIVAADNTAYPPPPPHREGETLRRVLLALIVLVPAAKAGGFLVRYLRQPPVIGEMLVGICLGPSLLGRVAPGLSAQLFPPEISPLLGLLAMLGVVLYMFLVGLELDLGHLREKREATLIISHASIVVPFVLGALLALGLYRRVSAPTVPFTSFSLFLGVSLSVTAFPVLARILKDRRLHGTPLGTLALTCAAVDDVTAWCLLALAVAVARAELATAWLLPVQALGYVALMLLLVRPALRRWAAAHEGRARLSEGALAVALGAVLASAMVTDVIGIHAVFGAFLLGALIPSRSRLAHHLVQSLEGVVSVLLLPIFFALTGLRTQLGLFSGVEDWLICAGITAVASIGKFGGSAVAARLSGVGWREASALGVLMNTRGLMELVVLTVGLELGVVSPKLFAMLVVMAVVTTVATAPILQQLAPAPALTEAPEVDGAPKAEGSALGTG